MPQAPAKHRLQKSKKKKKKPTKPNKINQNKVCSEVVIFTLLLSYPVNLKHSTSILTEYLEMRQLMKAYTASEKSTLWVSLQIPTISAGFFPLQKNILSQHAVFYEQSSDVH